MVKNTGGGSRAKKMARKHLVDTEEKKRIRYKDRIEHGEMYGKVTKTLGNGMCYVLCNDGKERLCIIRRRFKRRNKRDNFVQIDKYVLIGLREWESGTTKDGREKCDLLEVYSYDEEKKIQLDREFNVNILKRESHMTTTNDDDVFVFEDEEREKSEMDFSFDDL
jgi:initiation factor 1A